MDVAHKEKQNDFVMQVITSGVNNSDAKFDKDKLKLWLTGSSDLRTNTIHSSTIVLDYFPLNRNGKINLIHNTSSIL